MYSEEITIGRHKDLFTRIFNTDFFLSRKRGKEKRREELKEEVKEKEEKKRKKPIAQEQNIGHPQKINGTSYSTVQCGPKLAATFYNDCKGV